MEAMDECVLPEIRLWRVAHAMHANIPRSVVRQPTVMEHRPEYQAPGRRELLDLAGRSQAREFANGSMRSVRRELLWNAQRRSIARAWPRRRNARC